jgi:hypothetical protein
MIRPATYPLSIIRRSTFNIVFQLFDVQGGSTLDWSSYTILSQLWDRKRSIKYKDFTVDTSNITQGLIVLRLTADQTLDLPTTGVYDCKVIFPDGSEYFFLKGSFTVSEGYTDD